MNDLLAPIEPALFYERCWSRLALHLHGAGRRFANLLGAEELVELASREPDRIDVIRGGLAHPLRGELRLGERSLRLRGLHECYPPATALAERLARELNERVAINVYHTPSRDAPGLAPHSDPYSLFVLQLEGAKRWELLGYIEGDPMPLSVLQEGAVLGDRGLLTLHAGEVLYLPPRLRHHVAPFGDEASLHLAVALPDTAEPG